MEMPAIKLDNGTVEALKWIGLLAMTGDHALPAMESEAKAGRPQ